MFHWRKVDKSKLRSKKAPKVLFAAELLIMLILMRYMYTMAIISYPLHLDLLHDLISFINIFLTFTFAVLAASAMMGITSSKPGAWGKVVRSGIILLLVNLFTFVMHKFDFITQFSTYGLLLSGVLVVLVCAIMFLPSVRRYYLPPMHDMPPVKEWVMSALLYRPLINVDRYEFTYGGEETDVDLDLSADPSTHIIPDFKN